MRKIGMLVFLACPLALLAGCGGPSSMPVVQIAPWVPPAPGNPLVLTVKVTNKGAHNFLNSSGANISKLMVTGKDGNTIIGTTIEEKLDVSGWGDGNHSVALSPAQTALYNDPNVKQVIFEVVVIGEKPPKPPEKIVDTEIVTK
jgi:hypothetical protein